MLTNPPAARLLVLVPGGDLPVVDVAQRIWKLAADAGAAVLLVGLAVRPDLELPTRRSLAQLENHTRFDPVPVSTRVARASNWVTAVKQLRRPGDCVVCFATQHAPAGPWGWRVQPLSQALRAELKVPAYVVTDVPMPVESRSSLREAVWLALSLGVLATFFGLQAWIQTTLTSGAATALLMLSVVAEFWLLGLFNRWRI